MVSMLGCFGSGGSDPKAPELPLSTDIYAGGFELRDGTRLATVWKNGQATALINSDGDAQVNALAVSNAGVFAAGRAVVAGHMRAVSWQNGVATLLSDPDQEAEALAVLLSVDPAKPSPDVYVAGWCGNGAAMVATYWLNGTAVALGDGVNDSAVSTMVRNGSDLYVGGWETRGQVTVAKVWKNGRAVALSDGSQDAQVTGLAVAGQDLYAVGMESGAGTSVIKLWKNLDPSGQEVSHRWGYAIATGLAVQGTDVYVAGLTTQNSVSVATIWKNGHSLALSSGAQPAGAGALFLNPGRVAYLSGWESDGQVQVAKYWIVDAARMLDTDEAWSDPTANPNPKAQPKVKPVELTQHRASAQALAMVAHIH